MIGFGISSESEYKMISFSEYVMNMGKEQKNIYFITGADKNTLKNSPLLERLFVPIVINANILFKTNNQILIEVYLIELFHHNQYLDNIKINQFQKYLIQQMYYL